MVNKLGPVVLHRGLVEEAARRHHGLTASEFGHVPEPLRAAYGPSAVARRAPAGAVATVPAGTVACKTAHEEEALARLACTAQPARVSGRPSTPTSTTELRATETHSLAEELSRLTASEIGAKTALTLSEEADAEPVTMAPSQL